MPRPTFTIIASTARHNGGAPFSSVYERVELDEVFGDKVPALLAGEIVTITGRMGSTRYVCADVLAARALGVPFVA